VLLPLFTVGLDRCAEGVIIACGLYLLVEEEKRKKNENTGFIRCSEQDKKKENFTFFGLLKDERQTFFKYFRKSFSKFENFKQMLHTDIEKKNSQ
jgi:hypothetical protein